MDSSLKILEEIKESINKYGIRNTTTVAVAPTWKERGLQENMQLFDFDNLIDHFEKIFDENNYCELSPVVKVYLGEYFKGGGTAYKFNEKFQFGKNKEHKEAVAAMVGAEYMLYIDENMDAYLDKEKVKSDYSRDMLIPDFNLNYYDSGESPQYAEKRAYYEKTMAQNIYYKEPEK